MLAVSDTVWGTSFNFAWLWQGYNSSSPPVFIGSSLRPLLRPHLGHFWKIIALLYTLDWNGENWSILDTFRLLIPVSDWVLKLIWTMPLERDVWIYRNAWSRTILHTDVWWHWRNLATLNGDAAWNLTKMCHCQKEWNSPRATTPKKL